MSYRVGMVDPTPIAADLAAVAADLARCAQRLSLLAARLADTPKPEPPKPQRGTPVWDGPPEWLDTKQAAKIMGVTVKGLESLRMRGVGPKYVRIGRSIRYRLQDLPTPEK